MSGWGWLERHRVTNNWQQHRARGSLGGTDFGVNVGTAILAPADGRLEFAVRGTGGYTAVLFLDNGWRLEFMHCRDRNSMRRVSAGETINFSGGAKGHPGAGSSTGPHIHVHAVSPTGVRRPYRDAPLPAPTPTTAPRPGLGTVRRGSKGDTVRHLQNILNRDYPAYSKLVADGDFGPATERVVKEFQRRAGLAVDGVVGLATWRRLGQ